VGEQDTGDKRKSVHEHEHDSGREKARHQEKGFKLIFAFVATFSYKS
jgi:hypothetical protein